MLGPLGGGWVSVIVEYAKHGEYAGYSAGCRCQPCKDAKAKYVRDRRAQGAEVDARVRHDVRVDGSPQRTKAVAEHHRRALRHLKDVHNPPRRTCKECRELFAEGNLR